MSTPTPKSDYMLLFRGTNWDKGLSPEQIQKVVADWYAWFERLKQEGRCSGGHPLQGQGKMVSGKGGRNVADGPFAESKEAIGGYFYLHVADEAEAVAIARMCPGLEYGCVVEVRPVADMCSVRARGLESGAVTGELAHA
jgi:hypothetical protein